MLINFICRVKIPFMHCIEGVRVKFFKIEWRKESIVRLNSSLEDNALFLLGGHA